MRLLSDTISNGLGKLTPSVWGRIVRAVNWYKRNRNYIRQQLERSKRHSELPGQPLMIVASLGVQGYQSGGTTSGPDSLGSQGIPSNNECEWLDSHYSTAEPGLDTPPRKCGDGAGSSNDICEGPCAKFSPGSGVTHPTNVCLHYWQSVEWTRENIVAGTSGVNNPPADWQATPSPMTIEWFKTDHAGDWMVDESLLVNSTNVYVGGNHGYTPIASAEEDNLSEDWFEDKYILFGHVGMPPAINLAPIGAVLNSELSDFGYDESTEVGWDHWESFTGASNCRHGELFGVLPPALDLEYCFDSDGEKISYDWADFNPVKVQPINHAPLVMLHFFPCGITSPSKNYTQLWNAHGREMEMQTTFPFFCVTPLYSGDGCCCNIGL